MIEPLTILAVATQLPVMTVVVTFLWVRWLKTQHSIDLVVRVVTPIAATAIVGSVVISAVSAVGIAWVSHVQP